MGIVDGNPGRGGIVPFASGVTPVTMTTTDLGVVSTVGLVGFGVAVSGVTIAGGLIDLSGTVGGPINFAFSVPRSGTISSITAFFNTTAALALPTSTVTITGQLYSAAADSNLFAPIPGASVTLDPPLTGTVILGTISTGANVVSIPVVRGTRLLLVFSTTAAGTDALASTVVGNVSAGVNII